MLRCFLLVLLAFNTHTFAFEYCADKSLKVHKARVIDTPLSASCDGLVSYLPDIAAFNGLMCDIKVSNAPLSSGGTASVISYAKDFKFFGCAHPSTYNGIDRYCSYEYTPCGKFYKKYGRCNYYRNDKETNSIFVQTSCVTCSEDTPYVCEQSSLTENGSGSCSSPNTTPQAGNPIRIATGNKYQVERYIDDLSLPFEVSYNSSTRKWTYNFLYQLINIKSDSIFFHYYRPDGKIFTLYKKDNKWNTLLSGALQVQKSNKYDSSWLVNYYGQHEYYDDQGRILRIEKPQGIVQTFTWSDQQLVVLDQQSHRLTLIFDDKKRPISAVQPNGKPTTMLWSDDDKLLKVTQSDGSIRQYHYENSTFPKHLTGITDGNGERFATWTYDDKGRAIASEHAGSKEKTILEFHSNNSTTVTNPLGKKTTYHFKAFSSGYKVVKVEGQQTEHCAAANKAYTYYDNGLLKTKTDWKGMVTAFEYNDRGLETKRTMAVGTPNQYEVVTEWHDTLRLPTAKITRGEREEYRYDEHGRLIKKDN
ncbi:hypothetical protein [Zooshikella ganghwensis]|uniref:hypothetical protein n=1 Tax=Zooshikella ganghwensis TaxID=202772 RepID=UPI0012F9ED72|nr:hypothetical protein [Zooshikella ganghwensis]